MGHISAGTDPNCAPLLLLLFVLGDGGTQISRQRQKKEATKACDLKKNIKAKL